ADPGPERRDEQSDFIVGQDLVVPRLLRVDDLAPEREDGLGAPIPSLLRRAAGRGSLDDETLTVLRVALRALGELRGESLVVHAPLARQLARLAGGLPRLGGAHALVDDLARRRRVFLEGFGELVVDDLLDEALDVAVAQLGLRLPLELRLWQPDRDHRRESFPDVVAGDAALEVLEKAVGLRVVRERTGQRRPEPGQVRAALARVDVVREREDALLVTVVVLKRHLDLGVAFLALEEQHLWVQRGLVLVQVLDELDDAALVQESVAPPVALVLDDDLQAPVQERQLAQPVAERVEREDRLLEDLGVRLEPDDRAGLLAGARRGQGAGGDPVLVALRPLLAVPADLDLEPFAERVHDGDADAAQAAGDLVRGVLELPAGVQN